MASRNENEKSDEGEADDRPKDSDVPMELTPAAKEKRGFFKKCMIKLGERVGTIQTTELPAAYLEAAKDADQYKEIVSFVCKSAMALAQQDPLLTPTPFSDMRFESPVNMDPYELLDAHIYAIRGSFNSQEAIDTSRHITRNLAVLHRRLQDRTRRCLHFMRTFLNVEWENIAEERKLLMRARENLDYARHQHDKNPTEKRKEKWQREQKSFESQLEKVLALLKGISAKKETHADDLIRLLRELHAYHDACYRECSAVRQIRTKLTASAPKKAKSVE